MADGIVRVAAHECDRAAQAIAEDGCVIIERAVPTAPLGLLRRRMDRDTHDLLRYCATIGGNPRAAGHLQQGPPPFADYVFADVAMNRAAVAVAQAVYAAPPRLTFYNGNTNCPGSVTQHLHMDGVHSTQPGEPVAPASSMVVNIPPGPMHRGNGAIELWPGSHRVGVYDEVRPDGRVGNRRRITPEMQACQRACRPPLQACAEPGDILLRDVRLWHRGVPNPSRRPRHMIALIYSAPLQPSARRLPFGAGCENALEGRGADANADYTNGPIDYLFGPTQRMFLGRTYAAG